MSSIIKVNTVQDADGNNIINESGDVITVGASGDTVTVAGNVVKSNALQASDAGNIVSQSGTTITVGASGDTVALASGASQTGFGSNPFKNIIINGDMSIAQRGTSASSQTTSAYLLDRWKYGIASQGTWTMSQSTDVPTGQGFANSFKADCTTADASPAASDKVNFQTRFEGQNLQYLKKGTSNAESLTASFWVKSNKTGTYICELQELDNDRAISNSYTISSANTWEKKTITFPGDTTGGTIDNDNARSLDIIWYLGSGSDLTSGTLQTSWGAKVNANRAVGQVNLADSTSNEWYITGAQLEAGTSASDFEFLPVDVNLRRCKRYFQTISRPTHGGNTVLTGVNSSANNIAMVQLPVEMRAGPSISQTGTNITLYSPDGSSNASASNPTLSTGSFGTNGGRFLWGRTGNIYAGFWVDLDNDDSYYNFTSEI